MADEDRLSKDASDELLSILALYSVAPTFDTDLEVTLRLEDGGFLSVREARTKEQ